MLEKPLGQKLTIYLLLLLFVVGALEILAYFYFIYGPASAILGQTQSLRLEIPALSQILKSPQITDESVSLSDDAKRFLPEKYTSFKSLLDSKLSAENTFVKNASMEMIIGGKIENVEKLPGGDVQVILTNSTGGKVTHKFTKSELENTRVTMFVLSPSSPTRTESEITKAITGDYFIVSIKSQLLNKDSGNLLEMEIFRTPEDSTVK